MKYTVPDMRGRKVMVTGATSGIGRATAEALARAGADLVLLSRQLRRGEDFRRRLARETGATVDLVEADLSSQLETRRAAQEVLERHERLDVLVNNAGYWARQRTLTDDGVELGLAVNVLAPWMLTSHLRPLLEASAPSRVINLAGIFYKRGELVLDDLHWSDREFRPMQASTAQQLARVLLTRAWARRLQGTGVDVYAVHPGPVLTEAQKAAPWWTQVLAHTLARPGFVLPEEGCLPVLQLTCEPRLDAPSDSFYRKLEPEPVEGDALDDELGEDLWAALEAMVHHPRHQPRGMKDW